MNPQISSTRAALYQTSLISILFVSATANAPALGQSGTPASGPKPVCNDQSREVDIVAGDHNPSSVDCTVITFTVAGQTLSTPATCRRGYSHFPSNIYKCQSGSESDGNHCKARGVEVTYYSYTDGACNDLPDLAALGNLSWTDFAKVPEALLNAMSCKPPERAEKQDWSAVVIDCDNRSPSNASIQLEQTYQNGLGSSYRFSSGTFPNYTDTTNPFETAYDLAQATDPSVVPGLFGEMLAVSDGVDAVHVQGLISIEHFEPGADVPSHVLSGMIDGAFHRDGRFDFTRVSRATNGDGKDVGVSHRTTCDLRVVRDLTQGAEFGVAYYPSSPEWAAGLADTTLLASHMYRWVTDPFAIPAFAELDLVSSEYNGGEEGLLQCDRVLPSSNGSFTSLRYIVDPSSTTGLLPLYRTVHDSTARVLHSTSFEDYQQIEPGIVRPMTIVQTWYRQGLQELEPEVRTRLSVSAAKTMSAGDAANIPAPYTDGQLWLIWE